MGEGMKMRSIEIGTPRKSYINLATTFYKFHNDISKLHIITIADTNIFIRWVAG